ncbi:MAG: hypothetical protein EOP05_06225 [Proteobacteria bacterium]|nr:MAG: hypothetical protein EOP05_06225 [Pseudomonadota bacterium]
MGVRESLTLDHFYFNASDEDFAQLLKMKDLFRAISHSKSEVQGDSWEGLYLYSRPGSYLEILRARRAPGYFAICLSPSQPYRCDVSHVVSEVSANWQSYQRKFPDGSLWHEAFYIDEVPSDHDSLFFVWAMKHYQRHLVNVNPMVPRSVDGFKKITLTLGEDHTQEILSRCQILPIAPTLNDRSISLEIPDRDGFRFYVEINLVSGNSRFDFKTLELTHCHPENFDNFKALGMGKFELTANGSLLTLRKD